ncbi:MAG: HD domain-containing phosphohydrolase [Pseudomonadota bacterium]|nr:HD domain-containing phosphohydrolase [Pseudomonadota bacterium]
MDAPSSVLADDHPRIEVAVVPDASPFAREVRAAAVACGAVFVKADAAMPTDLVSRIYVVDLTRALATARLGPRVIAISRQPELDAYDIVDPAAVGTRLPRVLRNLVEQETLRARVVAERGTVEVLNQIGYALSAITDRHRLLDELLTHARRLLQADGGTVYLVEDGFLHFAAAQNDTIPFFPSRRKLAIDEHSLAGWVALRGSPLNIDDVRRLDPTVPYRPNLSFDEQTGYQTCSVLVVPLMDRDAHVIGALAMINRKPVAGVPLASFEKVLPFSDRHVALARSIAGQAAVALENHRLYRDIQLLFHGFVEAAVTAIEARDPTTGGHSHRVAELSTLLAREVTESDEPPFAAVRFSAQELTELHYASMLHDFGKVGVREEVLLKATKLFPWEIAEVEMRFRVAALQAVLESVREELAEHHLTARLAVLQQDLALVRRLNRPNAPMLAVDREAIRLVAERWRLDDREELVLRPREVERLCIPRGTLDPAERLEIERHVEHTHRFLRVIPWTRELRNVPAIAYAHHEKLDGTGYPRKLTEAEIPFGAKLMAIADIYDALTAMDRPYKDPMTPEKAIFVLREEASAGKILSPAVELLAGRQLWKRLRGRGH